VGPFTTSTSAPKNWPLPSSPWRSGQGGCRQQILRPHRDSFQHREFVTHTGWLGKKRISVVSTGIGTDNIDIVLNELDALVNIDFATRLVHSELTQLTIIRMGTAGALQAISRWTAS